MKQTIAAMALAAFTLTGCAASKKAVATNIVAASDVAADTLADSWSAAVGVRVDECRAKNLPTPEARAECLGAFHPDETEKVITAVEALVAVQLAIKAAAECEALDTCLEATDWDELARQASTAWDALLPYLRQVKKEKSK